MTDSKGAIARRAEAAADDAFKGFEGSAGETLAYVSGFIAGAAHSVRWVASFAERESMRSDGWRAIDTRGDWVLMVRIPPHPDEP